MALGNLIKSWENIMRDDDGVSGTVQVLSQLVWMLFLKVYDIKEDNWEAMEDDYKSGIPEGCRWRDWAVGTSQKDQLTGEELVDFVNSTLFPKLKSIEVNATTPRRIAIVREMMSEAFNYMKDGICIRQAVNLLNEIHLDNYDERHSFNDIYETLLKQLQSAGRSGEFYTPRAVTQFMTEMVNPQLGKIVADFACGTGGFLVDVVEHLKKQRVKADDNLTIENTVIGVEKKQFPYMLCTTNLLLHDVDDPKIIHGNSLAKNVRDYTDKDMVDFILMNPPYGGHEQEGILNNFPLDLRNSETANLFLIEILYRLNNKGRVGLILPDGFLFGEDNSLAALKKKLFKECNVHTIIRLCGSVFAPYTSIATNLLFFNKTGETKETWFYRYDMPEGYKAFSKTKPMTAEHLQAVKEWWNDRTEIIDEKEDESMTTTYKSKMYTIDEIIANNYNIDLCGFPTKEEIILSPEETITTFKEKRESLDAKIDSKLQEIIDLLEV